MSNGNLRALLREEPQTFHLICKFNQLPALYVDCSHLAGLVDEHVYAKLLVSPRGRRKLSQWILGLNNIGPTSFFDFTEHRRRLALLEPDILQRLLTYTGAMLASSSIAKIIDHNTVISLKKSLGEDVYFFAVKRAAFLVDRELASPIADSSVTDWKIVVRRLGCQCLEQCFSNEPRSLTSRLRLKFGQDWPLDFSCHASDEQKEAAWSILKKVLFSEIDDGGLPCFN